MGRPQHVTVNIVLTLVAPEPGMEVPAQLRYDAADPFAVTLVFGLDRPDESVEWVFARDLLTCGLAMATGEGDVRITPGDEAVSLTLSSPSGSATLAARRDALADFLMATYGIVRPGREVEHLDMDSALESFLYDGSA